MSPNARRLTEYLRACAVNRRNVTWSYVDTELVCERLGWSLSTFRRAKREVETSETRLVIRTVFVPAQGKKGKWRLMIAIPSRLDPDQLVFEFDTDAKPRRVYKSLPASPLQPSALRSECQSLEGRASPEMAITPRPRRGRSARPPTKMVRLGYAIARRFHADASRSKWLVPGELDLDRCAFAFARRLAGGGCADGLFRAAMRSVELAHVHNTDAKFDRSGRMRRRSWGFVLGEACKAAPAWSKPQPASSSLPAGPDELAALSPAELLELCRASLDSAEPENLADRSGKRDVQPNDSTAQTIDQAHRFSLPLVIPRERSSGPENIVATTVESMLESQVLK